MKQTVSRTDVITRDQLIRAVQAVRRRIDNRATGTEAMEELAREIEEPHACVAAYAMADDGGPCETCWEWVGV